MRVGVGFDLHRLGPGRRLVLGGVEIPYPQGLEGHSDADVVVHALIDALLGAAALGGIGTHFPPADPRYSGASSLALLGETLRKVEGAGFRPRNCDVTVVADAPRLDPWVPAMVARISEALGLEVGRISVKATSAEGLLLPPGAACMAAVAVALLEEAP